MLLNPRLFIIWNELLGISLPVFSFLFETDVSHSDKSVLPLLPTLSHLLYILLAHLSEYSSDILNSFTLETRKKLEAEA